MDGSCFSSTFPATIGGAVHRFVGYLVAWRILKGFGGDESLKRTNSFQWNSEVITQLHPTT